MRNLVPDLMNWRRLMQYRRDCYDTFGRSSLGRARSRTAVHSFLVNIRERLAEEVAA